MPFYLQQCQIARLSDKVDALIDFLYGKSEESLEIAHITLVFLLRGFLASVLFSDTRLERTNVEIINAVITVLENLHYVEKIKPSKSNSLSYFAPCTYKFEP